MERVWLKNYPKGVDPNIAENSLKPLNEIIQNSYDKYKDEDSFTCMGKTLTFGELKDLSTQFSSYLHDTLGMRKGDKIALMMPNILQYPVCLHGAAWPRHHNVCRGDHGRQHVGWFGNSRLHRLSVGPDQYLVHRHAIRDLQFDHDPISQNPCRVLGHGGRYGRL